MKKMIIVNNNMQIGGVQKSLLNLLNEISDEFDITLLLFNKSGEYLDEIPSNVKIIEGNTLLKIMGMSQSESKKLGYSYYFIRAFFAFWSKKILNNKIPYSVVIGLQKQLDFDYAISYLQSGNEKSFYSGCNEFVLKKIRASQKITFIHCDFLNYGGNTHYNSKIYRKFDKIAIVSEACKDNFEQALPDLKTKTYVVKNFNNYTDIVNKSIKNPVKYTKEYIQIVTISRLAQEKGILRMVPIIKKAANLGHKFQWHILGDGPLKDDLYREIEHYQLKDVIILHGNKKNPYRYLKNADLLLLPSYHEAAPMVFDEARALNIPILATKTTSTTEMIIENSAGWVCENNEDAILCDLLSLLEDKSKIKNQKRYIEKLSNEQSKKQFYELIKKSKEI